MKSPQLLLKEIVSVALAVVFIVLFSVPLGSVPPLGDLLNPNGGIWTLAARANHPVLEELRLPGLDGDVTVLRDDWGVPHIFATTNHDLFLALGYVHAQDRMWQMDIQYRFAAGRLSEILGRKYINQDTFMRTIGLQSEAAISLATLSAADTSLQTFTAYAAGVNAWISQTPTRNLPLEFRLLDYRPEPWTPVHSAAEGGLLAFALSADFSDIELGLLTDGLGAAAVDELFPVTSPSSPGSRSSSRTGWFALAASVQIPPFGFRRSPRGGTDPKGMENRTTNTTARTTETISLRTSWGDFTSRASRGNPGSLEIGFPVTAGRRLPCGAFPANCGCGGSAAVSRRQAPRR